MYKLKLIFIMLIIILSNLVYASTTVYRSGGILYERTSNGKTKKFSGTSNILESSGIRRKTTYKNGIEHGKFEIIYRNGQIHEVGFFSNGTLDRDWKIYYENGKIREEGYYSKGKKDKTWKKYYENGVLAEEINYKNSKLHGRQIKSTNSGEQILISNYQNDILHGYFMQKTSYGEMILEGTYANGLREGFWKDYYSNGNLKSEATYKNNKIIPEGRIANYSERGVLQNLSTFKNGMKHGDFVLTRDDERIELHYKNNLVHGTSKIYDLRNNLKKIENYENGLKHGLTSTFHPATKNLISEINFKNGKMEGNTKIFDSKYRTNNNYAEGNMKNNKRDGVWNFYAFNSSGSKYYLELKINYKEGIPDGEVTAFTSRDAILYQGNYKNGKREGLWILNYTSSIEKELKYTDGVIQMEKVYTKKDLKRDILKYERSYKYGIPLREVMEYQSNGAKKETTINLEVVNNQDFRRENSEIQGGFTHYSRTGNLL